jgi:hypothetical protein
MKNATYLRSCYSLFLISLFLCSNWRVLYSQDGSAKVTLILDDYVVYKEDNGLMSHGVNLYFGWIVAGPSGHSGGASQTAPHLQNNNGLPLNPSNKKSPRVVHPATENLFTVEIPKDGAIYLVLQMVAENDTTAEVKATFRKGQLVDFGEGPPDINFNVSMGDSQSAEQSAIADLVSVVKNIFFRKGPDHNYGRWILSFTNTGGEIEAQVQKRGTYCSGDCLTPVPIDGKRRGFMSLRYDDGENNIYPEFDILATPEGD